MIPTAQQGFTGAAPTVQIGSGNREAEKYGKLWATEAYRKFSPGEDLAQRFLTVARPRPGARVVDFGCGTGRGAMALALFGGLKVTMVDFVNNCLDADVREALTTQAHALTFAKCDLERGPLPVGEYGYCTDVMEHIPPDKVDQVLLNIVSAAQHVFFSIATEEDRCGEVIGETLHLTVKPYAWWLQHLTALGCIVHWSQENSVPAGRGAMTAGCQSALFYVSAWMTGQSVTDAGLLNVSDDVILANVRANTEHTVQPSGRVPKFRMLGPHVPTDDDIQSGRTEVMILGGGPSLAQFEEEIRQRKAAGTKIVTLNGAYGWALERGLGPVTQMMVDARPFNARFVQPIREDCLYLLASQCDPSVFEGLPWERTYLWHTSTRLIKELLDQQYGPDHRWWGIGGGSTVLTRAIPLLHFLGFSRFHLYGCDSCLQADAHHAYPQPENDAPVFATTLGGRIFQCHAWMISQCNELLSLVKVMSDMIELEIHGDGLLAWALQHAADLEDERAHIIAPVSALP